MSKRLPGSGILSAFVLLFSFQPYLSRFLGDNTALQIYAKSSADCIHIGIGPDGEKYALIIKLQPGRKNSAPNEIWVHSSVLSEPVLATIKPAKETATVPLALKTQIPSTPPRSYCCSPSP